MPELGLSDEIDTRFRIARLLREAMERRAVEGWRLARHVCVDPSQVSRWRRGEQAIPVRALVPAARFLCAPELLEAHPVARALVEEWARPVDLALYRLRRPSASREEVIGSVVVVDGHVEIRLDDGPDAPPPGGLAQRSA